MTGVQTCALPIWALLGGGGTDGPDEAVSFVADPCGRANEPEQLCDGIAAVPRCAGAQTDATGVARL